jgi:flavin reductase (DIM6/NTAB) family NADH-FMN oxidoreductase RutF
MLLRKDNYIMKQITMDEALKYTSPQPVSLISSVTPEGVTNLATVAWWTYLESEPAMIGFSMSKESYTCELITQSRKTALSIPGEAIAKEAGQCGIVSGRKVDKVRENNIELTDTAIKFPVHSRLAFICTIENMIDVGDCTFFICKVDEIFGDDNERQIFAWSGSDKLAPVKQ